MNPPIPANVACASEIWPANPVMIVIDRNATARVSPSVMRNTHRPLTSVIIAKMNPTMKIGNTIFVSRAISGVLYVLAIAGGGGSTPARGSINSRRDRIERTSTKIRNSTRNGRVGRRSFASSLEELTPAQLWRMSGSARSATPSATPATKVAGMFVSFPHAAAAIVMTSSSV